MSRHLSLLWIAVALVAGIGVTLTASPFVLRSQLSLDQKGAMMLALKEVAMSLPQDTEVLKEAVNHACENIPQSREEAERLIEVNEIAIPGPLEGIFLEALNNWGNTKNEIVKNCDVAKRLLEDGKSRDDLIKECITLASSHLRGT